MDQFYRETLEVSDDVKSDGSAADTKSTSSDTAAAADELTAVTDTTDVVMKTEEGLLLMLLHNYVLRYWLSDLLICS